jgi:quercetin dioxygenase-like cupin family protein
MHLRFVLLMTFAVSSNAWSQDVGPVVIRPDTVPWKDYAPGIVTMSLVGSGQPSGVYTARVRLAAQAKLPPHTHPDTRYTMVLRGTIYVGFGEVFDSTRLVAVPEGSLYVAPAGVPHFLWARQEAIYQESGTNPTATHYIEPRRPS